jgi:hypothetical protein
LIDEATFLLDRMRKNLAAADSNAINAQTRKDLDFYLTVAMGLLSGTPSSPVAGADPKTVEKFLTLSYAANGMGADRATSCCLG